MNKLSSHQMLGPLDMASNRLQGLPAPAADSDAATKASSEAAAAAAILAEVLHVLKSGDTVTGILVISPTSALTPSGSSTYGFQVKQGANGYFGVGGDSNYVYLQSFNGKPMLLNSQGNNVGIGLTVAPTAKLDMNGDIIRLRTAKTPASATATGNQGDIAWDANYVYVCVAANTWRRSPLNDMVGQATGARVLKRTEVSDANYTALTSDDLIAYLTLTAARTVQLVALPTNSSTTQSQLQEIHDEAGTAGTNNITVLPPLGKTINGQASIAISTNYGYVRVYQGKNGNFFTR